MGAEDGKKRSPLPFSWVHAWRENSNLDRGVRLVLSMLAQYMDKRGVAWPSYATLARNTGYSVRHVKRLIKKAETAGWLVIETAGGPPGLGGHPNKYRAVVPSDDMEVTTLGDESGDIHGQGGDTEVMEAVTPMSPEYSGNTQERILTETNSDQRFKNAPKRGSNEFLEKILKAMEEEPEALQRVLKDVENFTANEAHWVLFHCRKIRGLETGPNDIYDLAAGVLRDLWRQDYRFSRKRFLGFLISAAQIRDPENIHDFAETIDDVFKDYY